MKRIFAIAVILLLVVVDARAQYPLRTIRQLQEVSLDSLRRLDTLQRTNVALWTLQRSRYFGDTVKVRGVVVIPPKVINFTSIGYNFLIADTAAANRNAWGGVFIRPNISSTGNPGDTALAIQWGMLNIQAGDYIELTGYVDEFPSGDPVSATQVVPVYSQPYTILNLNPVALPPHVPKLVSDFYKGSFPSNGPNGIQFSTGEPMEFMRVRLTGLVVVNYTNQTNGTLTLVNPSTGDMVSTMDASKWFTLRGHRDPASTYALPAINTPVDTIWGYVMTNSGQEAPRGYRIAPLYPGDIVYGRVALPIVSTHRRNPIIVPPDSTPSVSVRVARGGTGIASVQLRYSLNNGSFVNANMSLNLTDTTYRAVIPQQPADTFVKYYINVTDSIGNSVRLASSAVDGSQADTLRGFFFYTVLNRAVTIRDIQTTPFLNGRTPYLGASVSVSGIITADTSSLITPPTRFRGTNVWYLQSGTSPWSGIWVHNDSLSASLLQLRNGDSVTVSGFVAENFDVTRIERLTATPVVHTRGNPLPAAAVQTTGTFGPGAGNGTPAAERYEGMLVQFNNVVLTDSVPTFDEIYEFAVDDGSGPVIVRRDGTNSYTQISSEIPLGKTFIPRNSRISFLRGVIYFAGAGGGFRYKLVPRSNNDFGTITSVDFDRSQPMPRDFSLGQNYPNPFNPSTTIQYSLPEAAFTTLKLYNLLGQEVKTLLSEDQPAGRYTARVDAASLPTGVYFYRLSAVPTARRDLAPASGRDGQAGSFTQVKRMLLLK